MRVGSGRLEDSPVYADQFQIYTGKSTAKPGVLNNGERRELVNALKAEDLKRRRDAAKGFGGWMRRRLSTPSRF